MKQINKVLILGLMAFLLGACGGANDPQTTTTTPGTPTPTPTPPPLPPPGPAATISFTSAAPASIGLQGSGQTTTSILTFTVKDINGTAVTAGQTVDFKMSSLNGGEYIGSNDATPLEASSAVAGASGDVTIGVTSGTVAGVITVTATVHATTISTTSSKISLGGGVPDSAHLSISATQLNLPGLVIDNYPSTIHIIMGDRYGNFNVLKGTSVSFYAESGVIDNANTTDEQGKTSASFFTSSPSPVGHVLPSEITNAELTTIQNLNSVYGPYLTSKGLTTIPEDGTVFPRRGWVNIFTTASGEEAFIDKNLNGKYDLGETLIDDLGEPYFDNNSNGNYDSLTEVAIDANGNGVYDGVNGVWDGPGCTQPNCQSQKTIWKSIELMFTGNGAYCALNADTFNIARGSNQTFYFMVGDSNLNRLVPGTTIVVSTTAGQLSGNTNFTVPDGIGGPTIINFTLLNNVTQPTKATISVKVAGKSVTNGSNTVQIIGCPNDAPASIIGDLQ